MEIRIVRYFASAFVDAASVEIKARDISALVEEFGQEDLLPITAVEGASQNGRQRVGFRMPNGEWEILLLGERFNVTRRAVLPTGLTSDEFSNFCSTAGRYLDSALSYVTRRAHRLAAIRTEAWTELSEPQLEDMRKNLLLTPAEYGPSEPFEWDWRQAWRIHREFAQGTELTNTIATVRRREIQLRTGNGDEPLEMKKQGLVVEFDINTVPEEKRARFEGNVLREFFDAAPQWHSEFRNVMESLIVGDDFNG